MYRNFLERPIWQQYLCLAMSTFLLFTLTYLLFIDDVELQAQQQQRLYQEKSIEIKRLKEKTIRYKNNQEDRLTLISEHELANLIEHCHLNLQSFKYSEIDEMIYWNIELYGQFSDFITLMFLFIDEYYYLDFQQLLISKHDSQLNFKFTLLFNKAKK